MLLSIIIPVYNGDKYIIKLLEILMCQIVEDVEIIVIDDGSTDSTKALVSKYIEGKKVVRLICQENCGESGARNTGIKESKGKYLYFLDCDDLLESGSILHFTTTIKNNDNLDLYCFSYSSVGTDKKRIDYRACVFDKKVFYNRNDFLEAYLSKKLPCHVCSVIINKELLQRNKIEFQYGLRIGADIQFLLDVFIRLSTAYYSDRMCYIYRIRNDSVMQGYKSYSKAQYHSFELRRNTLLSEDYQSTELKKYSNFWIENQLISNIYYYVKSDFFDREVTNNLINDCKLLKLPISKGKLKHKLAVCLCKLLPMKLILKLKK